MFLCVCEKYSKPITVQYYTASCVSWVPRLSYRAYKLTLRTEPVCMEGTSVQFSHSVMSSSLRPHGPQHAKPPYQLPEFTQTHVYRVCDAIQTSYPLSSFSPHTFSLSQYQGLFQWVSSSHQVATILEFQLQHHSFQWIFRTDLL